MLTISSYVHKYTVTVRKDKRYSSLSVQVLIFQSFFLKKGLQRIQFLPIAASLNTRMQMKPSEVCAVN